MLLLSHRFLSVPHHLRHPLLAIRGERLPLTEHLRLLQEPLTEHPHPMFSMVLQHLALLPWSRMERLHPPRLPLINLLRPPPPRLPLTLSLHRKPRLLNKCTDNNLLSPLLNNLPSSQLHLLPHNLLPLFHLPHKTLKLRVP